MVTYKNTATGETYKLGIELCGMETILSAAWGKGLRVACMVNKWNRADVVVVEAK